MKYIYDILINLHSKYYDFFDWNYYDELIHLKKIPIVKVNSSKFNLIKYNSCIFDNTFLDKIYKKCDFFKYSLINNYNYLCIICDSREALVVNLNNKGVLVSKSSMILDEENEVIDLCENMKDYDLELVSCDYNNEFVFMTRLELERFNYIKSELSLIESDKLIFLYYEYFNEKEDDVDKILARFNYELNNNYNFLFSKLYDYLKLLSFNK